MADTPLRKIRVDDELWEGFGQAVADGPDAEADRAKVLRQFMRWYRRERGAKLPERPDAQPRGDSAD